MTNYIKMAVDAMVDDEPEGPRVILGPVALERFVKAVRAAALEEAAVKCAGLYRCLLDDTTTRRYWPEQNRMNKLYAAEIRALKEHHD